MYFKCISSVVSIIPLNPKQKLSFYAIIVNELFNESQKLLSVLHKCIQKSDGMRNHFSSGFRMTSCKLNSSENFLCFNYGYNGPVRKCAKLWPDPIVTFRIRTYFSLNIWIMSSYSTVCKMGGQLLSFPKSLSLLYTLDIHIIFTVTWHHNFVKKK